MPLLRITESKMFAIEIVRSALGDPAISASYNLNGLWMHMDMEEGNSHAKSLSLLFMIHGAPSQVQALCSIESEGGSWVRGTCTISLVELNPRETWTFDCKVVDNEIVATLQ